MERLAFVGLGSMGSPMAKRLVGAGFELKVFDVLDERTHPLIELGAVSAPSLVEAAEGTEALVLMVANAEQAEGVLFGEGAAEALPEDAAVVVMSTIGPEAVRELADALAERDLRTVDAPVSGGVARAEKGDLLIMAGDLKTSLRSCARSWERWARASSTVARRWAMGRPSSSSTSSSAGCTSRRRQRPWPTPRL